MVNNKLWFLVFYQSNCYQHEKVLELIFEKFALNKHAGPCTNYKSQVRFSFGKSFIGKYKKQELTDESFALDLFPTRTAASLFEIVPLYNQILVATTSRKRIIPWLDVVSDNWKYVAWNSNSIFFDSDYFLR